MPAAAVTGVATLLRPNYYFSRIGQSLAWLSASFKNGFKTNLWAQLNNLFHIGAVQTARPKRTQVDTRIDSPESMETETQNVSHKHTAVPLYPDSATHMSVAGLNHGRPLADETPSGFSTRELVS